ncbi:MAG TPA: hypothetical protein VGD67_18405 [Pseudonocardiaceae bacterium]
MTTPDAPPGLATAGPGHPDEHDHLAEPEGLDEPEDLDEVDGPGDPVTRFGGVRRISGRRVTAVTGTYGHVSTGGTQVNIETATLVLGDTAGTTVGSPRRVADAMLLDLARRYVEPPGFAGASRRLAQDRAVFLVGEPGVGRRTAGMMLLHQVGAAGAAFRELPDEVRDESVLTPEAVVAGERLLLDLTDGTLRLTALRQHFLRYHEAVTAVGALWVTVLPDDGLHQLPEELRPLVVRVGRPDGREVLRRHLAALGLIVPTDDPGDDVAGALDVPGLRSHVGTDPMRELARLAYLVEETREAAEGAGSLRDWVEQTVAALSAPPNQVAEQLADLTDGATRALLFAAAMFERAPGRMVQRAADLLLEFVSFPDDALHRLERPDLLESLRRIDARLDGERRVRFGTVTYGAAVRSHYWDGFPWLASSVPAWLDRLLAAEDLDQQDRRQVLLRFAGQCARTGRTDDLFGLIRDWGTGARPFLLDVAEGLLRDWLLDEEHGRLVRRQLREWAMRSQLPAPLALRLVRLCGTAVAPTHPDQAVVRLRHLLRNRNAEVAAAAREMLVALASQDQHFLWRVLDRLATTSAHRALHAADVGLFAAVATPALLTGPPRMPTAVRSSVADCWHGLLTDLPHQEWEALAVPWFEAHAAHPDGATEDLLAVLVEAAGGRPDRLAELFLSSRTWAGDVPARRPTRATVRRLIHEARPPAAVRAGTTGGGPS